MPVNIFLPQVTRIPITRTRALQHAGMCIGRNLSGAAGTPRRENIALSDADHHAVPSGGF